MELITWYIILPLAVVSPVTGIIQSLGTPWGLFKHYWVLIKFLITIPSTLILFLHLTPIGRAAQAAVAGPLAASDLVKVRIQLVVASAAAIVVLLVATVLSVYKPKGLTKFGKRSIT